MQEIGITYTVREIKAMAERKAAWQRAKLAAALAEASDQLKVQDDKRS